MKDYIFASQGKNITIYDNALILRSDVIHIADNVRIDDFARVEGGKGLIIGKCVHICSFASIYGGGFAEIGDYCGITQGARILTGTESLNSIMSAAAPDDLRNPIIGKTIMEPYSFLGANSVVLPNITIGQGAVIGAGAVVTKNVKPWSIMAGVPAVKINDREIPWQIKCK